MKNPFTQEQWIDLKKGEPAKPGDRYNMGNDRFAYVEAKNGQSSTFVTPGMPWPEQCMCYRPQRRIA